MARGDNTFVMYSIIRDRSDEEDEVTFIESASECFLNCLPPTIIILYNGVIMAMLCNLDIVSVKGNVSLMLQPTSNGHSDKCR